MKKKKKKGTKAISRSSFARKGKWRAIDAGFQKNAYIQEMPVRPDNPQKNKIK